MYKIIVSGVQLDKSTDELTACRSAWLYRQIGWKDVKVMYKGKKVY